MHHMQKIATEPICFIRALADAGAQIALTHEASHLPARRTGLHVSKPIRACFALLRKRSSLKLKASAPKL